MTVSQELLNILVCPEDRTRLSQAEAHLISQLNSLIAAGKLVNRAGQPVHTRLDGGLTRQDGKFLYPVVEDIPVLLVDESIPLDQPGLAH